MAVQESPATPWLLDSSTFIHAAIVDRVPLVVALRSPLFFPEYVFRFELGLNARETTRDAAALHVERRRIGIHSLTLGDLDKLASLDAPRKIGMGELACAVIAERLAGGVLCDDWHAKAWLDGVVTPFQWHSIEDVLLDAAAKDLIGELDLFDAQRMLDRNQYKCRCDLQLEHVSRRHYASRPISEGLDPQ